MALSFDVSVTPKWKKKVAVDPSPILLLERFKGTPSLLFKDLKVGQPSVKGLWIRNSNDCTVTVCMTKLPPAERGLTFSETEFNLDALESKRVEVTWLPTSAGTWRDVIHVQVWGLPPPHLNYRVVIHLSAIEPKPKHKCCHVNPPLKAQNSRANSAAGVKKPGSVPGSCATCCKRNVVKIPAKGGAASANGVARGKGGKENSSRIPPKSARLVIKSRQASTATQQPSTPQRRSSTMDEDSLEEERGIPADDACVLPSEQFLPMVEGALLPSCNVPSTPIRRTTYSIRPNEPTSVCSPETPVNADTYMVLEEEEEKPRVQPQHNWKFIKVVKEFELSPLTKPSDKSTANSSVCPPSEMPMKSNAQWSPLPSSRHASITIEESSLNGWTEGRQLFPMSHLDPETVAVDGGKGQMPIQSSPILSNRVATPTQPPLCSPIPLHNPPIGAAVDCSSGWTASAAGCVTKYDTKTGQSAINHTYTRVQSTCMYEYRCSTELLGASQISSDDYSKVQRGFNEKFTRRVVVGNKVDHEAVNRAALVIQKNWRRILAKRETEKLRLARLMEMCWAAIVIQKNWRYLLAKKHVAALRAARYEEMGKAACILQKYWRRRLALKLATELRKEKLEVMKKSAVVIQRSWRLTQAKRKARKLRAERISAMNMAAIVLQRNWRQFVAKRQARMWRSERMAAMNMAAIVIQRNWRYAVAKRQARMWRAERMAAMNMAAIVIQRNWRYAVAKRQARMWRAERMAAMNMAAIVIQRNWTYVVAKRQARMWRAERMAAMNKAAIVVQRNWRYSLARRQARIWRAERMAEMSKAANIIQRNWKHTLAKRQARIWRAEKIVAMNKAACIFQKNWRCILAMRLASKLRAERLEVRNKAASVVQRNWRYFIAKREARLLRAERIEAINAAAVVIQKNWRCLLAVRLAAKLRAERLETMNRAACVFQKYARRFLAVRLVEKLRAERLRAMNMAACTIQKNWRVVLAKRKVAQLREERLEEMNAAACVIQKNWRRVLSQRLVAALRAERANDYSALRQEFALKVCSKFHVEMSAFDLAHKLASSLPPEQDLSLFLKYIQNGLRTKMLPTFGLHQCSKSTQTSSQEAKEFTKPKGAVSSLRRKTMHEKHETPKTSSGVRRCLCTGMSGGGGLQRASLGHMSPIRRKLGQKEVPERIRWSSVAEAVGCTPRK